MTPEKNSLTENEVPRTQADVPYWNNQVITMPWGMGLYRWHGKNISGYPKIIEKLENQVWVKVKNINVFQRIKTNYFANENNL